MEITWIALPMILQYVILGVIVYSGLFAGKLLCMIAPEELKPGRKNLVFFQKLLFFLIFVVFGFLINNTIVRIVIILVMLYFLYDLKRHVLYNNNIYMIYTFIGLFMGLTPLTQQIIYALFPSFLIGLPTYSLRNDDNLKVYLKAFIVFFVFLIGSLIFRRYIM